MYFIIFEERNEDEEERTENRLIDKICVSLSCNFNQGETIAYQYSNQYLSIEFVELCLVISTLVLISILNLSNDVQTIPNDVGIY